MKLFKKTDLLIILLLSVLSLFFLWYPKGKYDRLYVEIYHHNELLHRIPLDQNANPASASHISSRIVEIGEVSIEISGDGSVSFRHSDCPDQVCVHSGKIRRDGEQIACVPNQILVKIVGRDEERFTSSFTGSFNTVSTLLSVGLDDKTFQDAASLFRGELERLHLLYSIYDDAVSPEDSVSEQRPEKESEVLASSLYAKHNLKYINEHGEGEFGIHPDLAALLLYAEEIRQMSAGRVDMTIGELLALWHHAREEGRLPSSSAIREILKNKIEIEARSYEIIHDKSGETILIKDGDFLFDVGAIAKGFALDLLCKKLSAVYPDASFLISLGGNIKGVGTKKDWVIGIQHPDENKVFASFILPEDMAVATSGDYERFMEVDGIRYHHIIDVETGYPVVGDIRSVTVIAKTGALSDALTTALFFMPVEEGLRLAEQQGAEVFYILKDLKVVTSKGFPKWTKKSAE